MAQLKIAFILAGGKGERLRPLTDRVPKTLLEVAGKPVLQYNIDNARKHGVKKIVLGTGIKAEKIRRFFGSGKKFGVKIFYSKEKFPQGTAGALKLAEKFLRREKAFIMCNGDEVKNIDYSKLLKLHTKFRPIATIALVRVKDASHFGSVKVNGPRVLSFEEKKKIKKPGLVNAGAYVLDPAIFAFIPKGKNASIERDVFPVLAEFGLLCGIPAVKKWLPIDSIEKLNLARKIMGAKK